MKPNMNEPLWVERYRPTTLDECILPKRIKDQFQSIINSGRIPNMILSGGPGTGKTTVAKALCNMLDLDWIVINASENSGIDTMRTIVKDFASTVSFSDSGKCVIFDEADRLSPDAQFAFRGMTESFSRTCSFIFTCNYPSRIIEPLFSRLVPHIPFDFDKEELAQLQALFFNRIIEILKNENIEYDQKSVATLVHKFFPDNRRIIGQLQHFSRSGSIGPEALLELQEVSIENLVKHLKSKKFPEIRQWCADNSGNELSNLYSKLYKVLKDFVTPDSIPEAILILEDYQRYDSIVPDKELHLAALCVNLMMQCQFK